MRALGKDSHGVTHFSLFPVTLLRSISHPGICYSSLVPMVKSLDKIVAGCLDSKEIPRMLQWLKRTIESSCGKIYILYWKVCIFFFMLFLVVISFLNTRWVMESKCSLHWILQEFSVTITELLVCMPRLQWLLSQALSSEQWLLCWWIVYREGSSQYYSCGQQK